MRPTRPSCEIYIDGASRGNPGPAGVGAVCLDGSATPVWSVSKYIGETTNNVAEYQALIAALTEAHAHGQHDVAVKTDSELLARQIAGRYKVRDAKLKRLHEQAMRLLNSFRTASVSHIPRERNAAADKLAGDAVRTRVR